LLQSPGVSFIALGVVENPRFAIEVAVHSARSTVHTAGDISTSGFDGHIAIYGYLSMSHLFVNTLVSLTLAWSKNLFTALGLK